MADLLLLLLALPLVLACGYLLLLTLLSGQPPLPPAGQPQSRFTILVPAHDEAVGIAQTVHSLLALDYPEALRRILVIADNCSDNTAALAREAGAQVLERQNAAERGKGYALKFAYEAVLAENWADAVVVVDADTAVTANLLRAFAVRIESGAPAAQAYYGVSNPEASWRTRLATIALSIFHRVRGRGREALRVSAGLRGNGMCFTSDTLRRVPHRAFSIVEDLEYAIALGRAGLRVAYVDEAHALGEMVSGEKAARSQRQRWEGGRMQMVRQHGAPLLREALSRRDLSLLDLALDVLIPPLAYLGLAALLLALAGSALLAAGFLSPLIGALSLFPLLALLLHIGRGVLLSGLGARAWLDLAAAPLYLVWKIGLLLRRRASGEWVRTEREKTKPEQPP